MKVGHDLHAYEKCHISKCLTDFPNLRLVRFFYYVKKANCFGLDGIHAHCCYAG